MMAMKPKSMKGLENWDTSKSAADDVPETSLKDRQEAKLLKHRATAYGKCVSCEVALCDFKLHRHEGPCLRVGIA